MEGQPPAPPGEGQAPGLPEGHGGRVQAHLNPVVVLPHSQTAF